MKFDLSSIPANATVTGATLELYTTGNHVSNYSSGDKNKYNGTKGVYEAPYNFDENTVTWGNYGAGYFQSEGGNAPIGTLLEKNSNTSTGTWESFNVLSAVQDMIVNPSGNYGFMVDFDKYGRYAVEYASSENSNNSLRPKLTIEYKSSSNYINVSSPNGGEDFTTGDEMSITWTTDQTGNVGITLIGGNSNIKIADASASSGEYNWIIPYDTEEGNNYKILIGNGAINDESNSTFSINKFDSCHILIDQNFISVKSASSEQSGEGEAINAIDGDESTYWHTEYSPTEPAYPHELVFELDKVYGLSGLKYTPRQTGENGRISDYEIYVSSDGNNWGSAVSSGVWPNSSDEQFITFDSTGGKFVKFVAISEVNGNVWASVAEINLYYDIHFDYVNTDFKNTLLFKNLSKLSISENKINFASNGKYELSIFSVNGKCLGKVSGCSIGMQSVLLSKFNLAKGLYLVHLKTKGFQIQRKITINK